MHISLLYIFYDIVYRIDEYLFFYRQHGVSWNSNANERYDDLTRQIYRNHPSLYVNDVDKLISMRNNEVYAKEALNRVLQSRSYKLGRAIVGPFGKIKDFVNRIKGQKPFVVILLPKK